MFEWLDTEPRSSFGTALTQIPPGSRTLHHYSPPALLSFAAAAGKCKVDSGIWEFVGFCLAALHQSEVWALWTLWRRGRLSSPHQTTWGLHRQTDGRSLPGALLWKPRRTERSRQARWVREPTEPRHCTLLGWALQWALASPPTSPTCAGPQPFEPSVCRVSGVWHFSPSILTGREKNWSGTWVTGAGDSPCTAKLLSHGICSTWREILTESSTDPSPALVLGLWGTGDLEQNKLCVCSYCWGILYIQSYTNSWLYSAKLQLSENTFFMNR